MVEAVTSPWSPFTRERLLHAPILSNVHPLPESPTRAEDEELITLTGGRGFPILGGVAFGYPAARALAANSAPSEGRGGRRLFAYDRWHGPLYLDAFGGLGVGMWRAYVTQMARAHEFADSWPPLLVYPRKNDRTFWQRFAERFSLSSAPEAAFLHSDSIVAANPRIFVRTTQILRDVLSFCAREGARASLEVESGVAKQVTPELGAPEAAPPDHADLGAFTSRRLWVEEEHVIQVDSVLEQVIKRLDVTPTSAVHRLPPTPAFGSPRLRRFLDDQDAFRVSVAPAPALVALEDVFDALWGGGCLVMHREHEMRDGCLWLGLLPRERLPELTATFLDFEDGPEVLPTGPRSGIHLRQWPLWSWKGRDLIAIGGWHDWKLLFWSAEHGLWSYVGLPEQIDFLAGELRTWLEILAFNDELNESEQLGVEIAFPLGARRHCGQVARRLGLALCQALSDRYVSSHEGAGLWLRELTPPIGKPYCVARCDSAARALALVDAAADVIDPKVVAISSSTMSRAEIAQELAQRGVRPLSSSRQWWSDFRKLWRV